MAFVESFRLTIELPFVCRMDRFGGSVGGRRVGLLDAMQLAVGRATGVGASVAVVYSSSAFSKFVSALRDHVTLLQLPYVSLECNSPLTMRCCIVPSDSVGH